MAEAKESDPKENTSARSKVINSWNTSWTSIDKEPPIMSPIVDISAKRNQKSDKVLNKSLDQKRVTTKDSSLKNDKKVNTIDKQSKNTVDNTVTKGNSKDKLKDKSTFDKPIDKLKDKTECKTMDEIKDKSEETITKDLSKELEQRLNIKQFDDQSISNGIEETGKQVKQFKAQTNPVLNKLRKRKTDSMNPSVVIERTDSLDNKSLAESKVKDSRACVRTDVAKDSRACVRTDVAKDSRACVRTDVAKDSRACVRTVVAKDSEPVDMDADLTGICLRPDCYKKVNPFPLLEGKYCSSSCAVKQWTEDFQKVWKQ